MGSSLISKIWNSHTVAQIDDGVDLLYVDVHLLNEVSCPQAFASLASAGRTVRRPRQTLGTVDHNNATSELAEDSDPLSVLQAQTMVENCKTFGIECYPAGHPRQGIVHIIGPEHGLTQPGTVVVCGDSHTSTHGAFGAIAFGIGTSEVEHVLATQCLTQQRPRQLRVTIKGQLAPGVMPKDVALGLIREVGVSRGQGTAVEYTGPVISNMSVEGRMTLCNMSIEWGARMGLIAPDQKTIDYIEGRTFAPKGPAWDQAVAAWRELRSDDDAKFDDELTIDASTFEPYITWGTNPSQSVPVSGVVPQPIDGAMERALTYMDLAPGTRMQDIAVDRVFIGSCTNSRIEDLVSAASIALGRKVHPHVRALVVPGSMRVKEEAEKMGLDKIFKEAGFEWRLSGCSLCVGMNTDSLVNGERCASTSNRNFENRQGPGGRTHLVSPAMAAGAAIFGHFVDVREMV